jgi:hypothetical protein
MSDNAAELQQQLDKKWDELQGALTGLSKDPESEDFSKVVELKLAFQKEQIALQEQIAASLNIE